MSSLTTTTLTNPTPTEKTEARLEREAVLLLSQAMNRTALFAETPLAPFAKGLTQSATRWRHHLPLRNRIRFAALSALPEALDDFRAGVAPHTQAEQALQHCTERPDDQRPLIQLFQVDALLDKWALTKQGCRLFAAETTAQAVMVFAEERLLRQIAYEVMGHATKELAKNGLSLPEATPELAAALLSQKVAHLDMSALLFDADQSRALETGLGNPQGLPANSPEGPHPLGE